MTVSLTNKVTMGTDTATAAGDVAMDSTSGVPSAYVAGAARPIVAHSSPTPGDVPSVTSSLTLAYDDPSFVYDSSLHRLNLGTTGTSACRLAVKDHAAFTGTSSKWCTGAVQTNDGSTYEAAAAVEVPANVVGWVEACVIGRDVAGTERAFFVKRVRFNRADGAPALGTIQSSFVDRSDANMDATFTVVGGTVTVQVRGKTAVTVNWAATVKFQHVSTST